MGFGGTLQRMGFGGMRCKEALDIECKKGTLGK